MLPVDLEDAEVEAVPTAVAHQQREPLSVLAELPLRLHQSVFHPLQQLVRIVRFAAHGFLLPDVACPVFTVSHPPL